MSEQQTTNACQYCGYPIEIGEHDSGCPNSEGYETTTQSSAGQETSPEAISQSVVEVAKTIEKPTWEVTLEHEKLRLDAVVSDVPELLHKAEYLAFEYKNETGPPDYSQLGRDDVEALMRQQGATFNDLHEKFGYGKPYYEMPLAFSNKLKELYINGVFNADGDFAFDEIVSQWNEYHGMVDQLERDYRRYYEAFSNLKVLQNRYHQLVLADSGHNEFAEIRAQLGSKQFRLQEIKEKFLSSVRFRKETAVLNQEIQQLKQDSESEDYFRIGDNNLLAFQDLRNRHESFGTAQVMESDFRIFIQSIGNHYRKKAETVAPLPVELRHQLRDFDPQVQEEMSNIMMERVINPEIDDVSDSADKQDGNAAKQAYSEYMQDLRLNDRQAKEKYEKKIFQLPDRMHRLTSLDYTYNMEDFMHSMGPLADFVLNKFPHFRELLATQKQNEDFLTGVENSTIRGPHPGHYDHWDFTAIINNSRTGLEHVRDLEYAPHFKQLMDNFYYKNWLALKESEIFRQKASAPDIVEIDSQIREYLLKNIFADDQGYDRKVELKRGLLAFTDPEIAKLVVYIAFTETGHSGEYPFIDDRSGGSRNTEIYQYLERLSDEELESMREMKIPGMMEIIESIKANPDTYTQASLKSETSETSEGAPNPVYQGIMEHVDSMAVHFLEHGDEKLQIQTAKSLGMGKDNIDSIYPKLGKILEDSEGGVARELQQAIADRIRNRHDMGALRLWLDHTPKQPVHEDPYTYLLNGYDSQERAFPELVTMLQTLDAEKGDYTSRFLTGYLKRQTERMLGIQTTEAGKDRFDDQGNIKPEYVENFQSAISSFMESKTVYGENKLFNEKVISFIIKNPEHANEITKMGRMGLFDDIQVQAALLNNLDKIILIPAEKRLAYVQVFREVNDSPSQEIQRLKGQLIGQILETKDPVASYRKINEIFVKNNLPTVGKIYKVFEALHAKEFLNNEINGNEKISPTLRSAGAHRRDLIIYKDLLKVHIDSGNSSLRDYLQALQEAQPVLDQLSGDEQQKIPAQDVQRAKYALAKLRTLFENSQLGRRVELNSEEKDDFNTEYRRLCDSLGVKEGQKVTERISEMFLKPLGLHSITEALGRMKHAKENADIRGRSLARSAIDGKIAIQSGDLLKGVEDQYFGNILQNGSVAKEFLGASASSDATPLDTDASMVVKGDTREGNAAALSLSLVKGYGDLVFVMRDQGQFQRTESGHESKSDGRYELFATKVLGERHYGIRTGFASTEVNFMVARDNLRQNKERMESIFYDIAKNGFYVPVVDDEGKIIFTEQDYTNYRNTFRGIEKFDGPPFQITATDKNSPHYPEVRGMLSAVRDNREKVVLLSGKIREFVKNSLAGRGIELKEKFDPGLLGAELYDIGSTGRQTNLPGAYDFDLTVKLDKADFEKATDIIHGLQSALQAEKIDTYTKENTHQLRAYGCRAFGSESIDIDVSIVRKSEMTVYGSHDAINDKLQWISQHEGEEAHDMVVGNILLAKKILKEGEAYKKLEHGGIGGIGVENWVLLNGGNALEAFRSFYDAATDNDLLLSLDEFKKRYTVHDAGINVQTLHHDNYIDKLNQKGYLAMVETARNFLGVEKH